MCNAVQQCLAANNILLMCKGNHAFLLLAIARVKMADCFASQGYSLKKQTRWSNDKTIIELGYRKILWFVSVSQIKHLPQPSTSAWSARHRQIMIFCSTSSNNIIVNYFTLKLRSLSIATPPEASCSMTCFRYKKDFFYIIQCRFVEQRACIHSLN